ncbi:MAG: DUF4405 domain-containing protein [Anaerolineaceae bacterium]
MNKKNFIIDILIFAAFLIMASPNLSGQTIHEWLGLALLGTIIFHVFMHLDWISSVGKNFFKKGWHSSRLNFVVAILLCLSFITLTLSGIMISKTAVPALGISLGQVSGSWRLLHTLSADAGIILVGLHFALNWSVVVKMFKKYIFSPLGNLFHHKKLLHQPGLVRTDDHHQN